VGWRTEWDILEWPETSAKWAEPGNHNPSVGGSNPPAATIFSMDYGTYRGFRGGSGSGGASARASPKAGHPGTGRGHSCHVPCRHLLLCALVPSLGANSINPDRDSPLHGEHHHPNLADRLKSRLSIQAVVRDRSIENEVRDRLRSSLNRGPGGPQEPWFGDQRPVQAFRWSRFGGATSRTDAGATDLRQNWLRRCATPWTTPAS
jgi:hypothetical protein